MLLKAKKNKAIATKILPAEPISFVSACCVSCTPLVRAVQWRTAEKYNERGAGTYN